MKIIKMNIIQVNYQGGVLGSLMSTIPGLSGTVTEMNMLVWYLSRISAYLALNNSAKNLKR